MNCHWMQLTWWTPCETYFYACNSSQEALDYSGLIVHTVYVGYLYQLQPALQKQQQISDTRHAKEWQSVQGTARELNEQAWGTNMSIQGTWETLIRSEARSQQTSFLQQAGFKWFPEIRKQMLGLSLTYNGSTVFPHSRQPEWKLRKNNCWKTECSWNAREQEAEFSLGNITEGHSPILFGCTQLPLAHLELDQTSQLHDPTANSCQGTAVPAQPVLIPPEGQGDATNPQHSLCKERRRQHCPFNSNWLNLTLKNSGFNL